ncbi:MAG: hypothetical protein RLZZ338_3933 [Cyanobacteriota bacterium]|jgi:hypothetical protein
MTSITAYHFGLIFTLGITDFRSMSIYTQEEILQGILQKDVRNVGYNSYR